MLPTDQLNETIAGWSGARFDVLWQPDDDTALLGRGSRALVMIEDDTTERQLGPGPVVITDQLPSDIEWAIAPVTVPAGTYAACRIGADPLRFLILDEPTDVFGDR